MMQTRLTGQLRLLWLIALVFALSGAVPRSQAQPAAAGSGTAARARQEQAAGPGAKPANASQALYLVRPGDELIVTFRYTPEFNDDVTVGPDGRISLKATGVIAAAGESVPELERTITRDSASRLVDPDVSVQVKDFERPRFVVAGEVQTPGRFELRQPTTVLQAILLAGGPKEDSAMSHVYLFRRLNSTEAEVHELKLDKYDRRTRERNDLLLQPNDMILVRQDALEKIGRVIKLFNLGVYVNPLPQNGLF